MGHDNFQKEYITSLNYVKVHFPRFNGQGQYLSIWGQVLKYQFFQFIDSQKNNAELKGKAKTTTPVRNLFDTTPLIKYIPTSFDVLRW